MTRVLVGIDGSPHAARALRWAVSLAGGDGVEVVHVFSVPMALPISGAELYPVPDVDGLISEARSSLRGWVTETVPAVADDLRLHVREGAPAREILEVARAREVDLIVVGSRGLGGFRGMLLGSVSRQIAAHAPCPVAVIPEAGEPRLAGGEIVVGVDGSRASRAALRWAMDLTQRTGGKVLALATVGLALRTEALAFDGRLEPLVDHGELQARADELLRSVIAHELGEDGERVIREATVGDAASTLLARAEDADLLVVGSRGLGGFERLLLGSVSHHCATHAPCPVVIVPDPDHG